MRYVIEKQIKRSPNSFTDISRDSPNKNCRVLQEHLQRHITKYKNYPKKTGVAATLDILYGMKRIADQKCKGKFLGHFANLGKGPSRFRGGVPEGGWETWGYKEPEGEPHLIC